MREREKERERESSLMEKREREETQNPEQAPGSELSAQSPTRDAGFELANREFMT